MSAAGAADPPAGPRAVARRARGVTIAECAEHFGVTEEQLQEDLWQLVVCGLPGYGPDQLVDIQFWDDESGAATASSTSSTRRPSTGRCA